MDKDTITSNIVTRFFQAFDMLIDSGQIDSINSFCRDSKIDKRNFYRFRKEPLRKFYIHLIYILVSEYNINANWLVSGSGKIFR